MPKPALLTPAMISEFCRLRLAEVLDAADRETICLYLTDLLELFAFPPYRGRLIDWAHVAVATNIEKEHLLKAKRHLEPIFDAVTRTVALQDAKPQRMAASRSTEGDADVPHPRKQAKSLSSSESKSGSGKKRGPKPKPIVKFPEPLWTEWDEPDTFTEALALHMRRHGDSVRHLFLALESIGAAQDQRTLMKWCTGQLLPRSVQSLAVLRHIEERYRLPPCYFKAKLPHQTRATSGHGLHDMPASERRRMSWHLPDDFLGRPQKEQDEIVAWVRRVIISGSTDYRRYQAEAINLRLG